MGEAVSGRSVQRKEGETRRYEGVCGCSMGLNSSVVLFLYSVFVRVDVGSFLCSLSTAFLSTSIGVAVGEGGLGVAPLPSTNIAQFFCMNGLFHCGVGAVQQEWQQIKSVGFSV